MSRNVLLKILGGADDPSRLRRWINLWPPFLGAGIRVQHIAPDMKAVNVEMKLSFWNANYVGTHFGGSLFAMADPFYMLMLMANLGRDYIVWDKAASIRYRKPGEGTVRAEFRLTDAQLNDIREKLKTLPKYEPMFQVEVKDESGEVVAVVEKLLHVRRKQPDAQSELPAAKGCNPRCKAAGSSEKCKRGERRRFVYVPEHFRLHDQAAAFAFMNANPFVILVSSTSEEPFATHAPVVVRETGEHMYHSRPCGQSEPALAPSRAASGLPDHLPWSARLRVGVQLHDPRKRSYLELRRGARVRQRTSIRIRMKICKACCTN